MLFRAVIWRRCVCGMWARGRWSLSGWSTSTACPAWPFPPTANTSWAWDRSTTWASTCGPGRYVRGVRLIPSVPFDIIEYLHHHGLRRVTHVPCRSRRRTLWLRWIKCPVRWRPCPSPRTEIISSRRGTDTCASGIWSRLALIRYGDDGKPASSFSTNSLQHTDSYFVLADHLKCLIIHPWSSSDTSDFLQQKKVCL